MKIYYNDFDPFPAAWLENLIAAGEIPDGDVDDRSIHDVQPEELKEYDQVHLFAGIAGWPLALEWAGHGTTRSVWTASCPCPPFSVAGQPSVCPRCESRHLVWCPRRTGYAICASCQHAWAADPRHLWPEVWRLAAECRPRYLLGEQVASPTAIDWVAAVQASLELLGYRVRAESSPASSYGAYHIRERLWWMADADGRDPSSEGVQRGGQHGFESEDGRACDSDGPRLADSVGERRPARHDVAQGHAPNGKRPAGVGGDGGLADPRRRSGPRARDTESAGADRRTHREAPAGRARRSGGTSGLGHPEGEQRRRPRIAGTLGRREGSARGSGAGRDGLGDSDGAGQQERARERGVRTGEAGATAGEAAVSAGPWDEVELIPCGDGKFRPIEPGTFPLAHGVPKRVGLLRAYGNAIVPLQAEDFIRAYMPH